MSWSRKKVRRSPRKFVCPRRLRGLASGHTARGGAFALLPAVGQFVTSAGWEVLAVKTSTIVPLPTLPGACALTWAGTLPAVTPSPASFGLWSESTQSRVAQRHEVYGYEEITGFDEPAVAALAGGVLGAESLVSAVKPRLLDRVRGVPPRGRPV